ncbi:MAG: HEAT repeat domain-containing protein, partial [Spirochaetes bacterium]|nr:HEAT repeat domain-containing protein [Spirochaetota bacterium]
FSRVYYALADAAYKVKPGKISPIIETDYGYFIVKNEKVTKPNKDQLKELEKRDRYLNRIESIKSRYYNMVQENDLKKKIRDRYTININTALLTNKTAQPDDIIVSIPKTDIKVTYGECKGIIMLKMGTTSLADRKAKIQKIYEEYILPELIYHYAKDKKYDRDDEFQVNLSNKFLNTIYLQLENNLNLPVNVTEEELKEYYRKNEQKYYITKVVNKKPARVKQSFRDAKEIIKRNVEHEKRQTEIEKWRQSLLKEYHFNIDYSRLGLKKDANYYLKIGDKHFNNGKFKKALKYYKKALEKDKELTEIYVKLLLSYNNLNDEKSILTTTEQLQHVKNIDVEVLLKALSVKDEKLKRKFIEMIGLTGNIAAESKLIELYENEKEVKNLQSIIRALGLIKSNRAYDIFFKDLNNFETQFKEYSQNDKEVLKWYLIEAIGYIGKKESTTYLIGLLKKTDDLNLKCFIIEAFGRIRDNNAVPILEKLLEDKVWGVRVLAAESLKNITGKEYKIKDKSREATP